MQPLYKSAGTNTMMSNQPKLQTCAARAHMSPLEPRVVVRASSAAAAASYCTRTVNDAAASSTLMLARFTPALTPALFRRRPDVSTNAQAAPRSRRGQGNNKSSGKRSGGGGGGGGGGGFSSSNSSSGGSKGFAPPDARAAAAEPWEADVPAPYRAYYKPGYKPSRFVGPIDLLKRDDGDDEGGGVDVVTIDDVVASQLLSVAPPLAFLEGKFGEAPSIDDLYAAIASRAAGMPQGIARVFQLLPRAASGGGASASVEMDGEPGDVDAAVEAAEAAAAAVLAAVAAAADQQKQQPKPQHQNKQQKRRSPLAAAESIADLDPKLWTARAAAGPLPSTAPPAKLPSDAGSAAALLRAVVRACARAEDYLDPASSQLRGELPVGYAGVWPELAALRHDCAPNTASAVVGSAGHLYLHAARDLPPGAALTANRIGGAVLAPLAVRQAAVRALTGQPCRCARCVAEASLPADARALIATLHAKVDGEWARALDAAAATGDEAALRELAEDVQLDVDALSEAVAAADVPGGPDAADAVLAGAYAAYELAWSLEELTAGADEAAAAAEATRPPSAAPPNEERLAAAVRLLRAAAPGTEPHVGAALRLNELATARVSELLRAQRGRRQRTAASERRLLARVVAANESAEGALIAFYEAIFTRYGFVSEDGLLPRLQSALSLFYAGLEALGRDGDGSGGSGSNGNGGGAARERELKVGGIPVTVVDTAMGRRAGGGSGGSGGGRGGGAAPAFELEGGGATAEVVAGNVRLRVVPAAGGGGDSGGVEALEFDDDEEDDEDFEDDGGDDDIELSFDDSLLDDGPLPVPAAAGDELGGVEATLAP